MEKVALQEILRYLTLFQDVFKTQRLFAVELGVVELPQVVLETVKQIPFLVGITVKQLPLLQENALETTFKAQLLCQLITIIATLLRHLLQQHTLVQLLWVLAAVQGLPLAQGLTAIPAVRAEA